MHLRHDIHVPAQYIIPQCQLQYIYYSGMNETILTYRSYEAHIGGHHISFDRIQRDDIHHLEIPHKQIYDPSVAILHVQPSGTITLVIQYDVELCQIYSQSGQYA